jgi:hypothetical protein
MRDGFYALYMGSVDTLLLQLAGLPREDVLVDEVLKLLIGSVDAELLKRIGLQDEKLSEGVNQPTNHPITTQPTNWTRTTSAAGAIATRRTKKGHKFELSAVVKRPLMKV